MPRISASRENASVRSRIQSPPAGIEPAHVVRETLAPLGAGTRREQVADVVGQPRKPRARQAGPAFTVRAQHPLVGLLGGQPAGRRRGRRGRRARRSRRVGATSSSSSDMADASRFVSGSAMPPRASSRAGSRCSSASSAATALVALNACSEAAWSMNRESAALTGVRDAGAGSVTSWSSAGQAGGRPGRQLLGDRGVGGPGRSGCDPEAPAPGRPRGRTRRPQRWVAAPRSPSRRHRWSRHPAPCTGWRGRRGSRGRVRRGPSGCSRASSSASARSKKSRTRVSRISRSGQQGHQLVVAQVPQPTGQRESGRTTCRHPSRFGYDARK